MAESVRYRFFTLFCTTCGPEGPSFFGGVRTVIDAGGTFIEDPYIDIEGSVAHQCLQHHKQVGEGFHHNQFTIIEDGEEVGQCSLGGAVRSLIGALKEN